MSELDLDSEIAALPAWDFIVRINGIAFPTRQPTLAEQDTIGVIHKMEHNEAFNFIYSLFAEPRPEKSLLTKDALVSVLIHLVAYDFGRRTPFYNAVIDKVKQKTKDNAAIARAAKATLQTPLN